MDEFPQDAPARIHVVTTEFLQGETDSRITDCVTVVCGYTELLEAEPRNPHWLRKLRRSLWDLMALAYERRRPELAARLETLIFISRY
jgi:hypothetical protein